MPRAPRIWFPGAVYHIIQHGVDQQNIFNYDDDRYNFLKKVEDFKKEMPFKVYLYVLMDNHYHLTIETSEINISHIMQAINTSYATQFNKKYKRKGHLFYGRFKGILVDKDNYLLELSRYIHLNPVKAGIVDDPEDYIWSSYRSYINKELNFLVDKDLILSGFQNSTVDSHKRYEYFVKERLNINRETDWLNENIKRQRFLGSDGFIKTSLEKGSDAF